MAKRFTDTEKWKDDWYVSLSNDDRIVWQWLLDNCNHAGFCKRSISVINTMCRVNYTEDELLQRMDGRVLAINNLWFIPKFIKFQYSTLLSGKAAVLSVVKELFNHNCTAMISELFGNDYTIKEQSFHNHYIMIKDKDKDKDKDNNTLVGKNKKEEKNQNSNFCEKPKIGSRAIKISDDGEFAIFENGYAQKLGNMQKENLASKFFSARDIILDSLY